MSLKEPSQIIIVILLINIYNQKHLSCGKANSWYSGGVESSWVHSALRPPTRLLCQPRVIMIMEKSVEWLAGETELLGENLPQCRFIHHKPHMLPGRVPGPPRWEASD
jgi:hypothetical protein